MSTVSSVKADQKLFASFKRVIVLNCVEEVLQVVKLKYFIHLIDNSA